MAGIAYHPWFAPHGSKNFSDGNLWYNTTDTVNSLYDCVANAGTGNGRPDGKEAEICSIDGQNGLICYAIPNAKTPTYKHQEEVKRNLIDGYIENGVEIDKYFTSTETRSTGTSVSALTVGTGHNITEDNIVYVLDGGNIVHYGVPITIESDYIFLRQFDGTTVFDRVLNTTYTIVTTKKSPYLATQGIIHIQT